MATAPVHMDPETTNEKRTPSPKQLAANRANARKSTGPRTSEGKLASCMNAYRHGLTGALMVVDAIEEPLYYRMAAQYIEHFKPVGVEETQLVQKIVDLNWRINRISAIENNLFNFRLILNMEPLGETKHNFANAQALAWREDCAGPQCFEKLGRYEQRLHRSLFKFTDEFKRVRAERLRQSGGLDRFDLAASEAHQWYMEHYEKARKFADNLAVEQKRRANSQTTNAPTDDELASFRELLARFPERPTRPIRNHAAYAS